MSKLKHSGKVAIARKLVRGRTAVKVHFSTAKGTAAKSYKVSIFGSPQWLARREGIAKRVKAKQAATHKRAVDRKRKAN